MLCRSLSRVAEPAFAGQDAFDLPTAFRGAMRRLASGVAVVTASGPDGPAGLSATSVTSLSATPPSLLVCVNRDAGLHACLAPGKRFCVNLLDIGQRDIAVAFGGGVARTLRFTMGAWSQDEHGVPWLEGAQANIRCSVDQMVGYGTHSIVIGLAETVRVCGAVTPLIYQDGRYL